MFPNWCLLSLSKYLWLSIAYQLLPLLSIFTTSGSSSPPQCQKFSDSHLLRVNPFKPSGDTNERCLKLCPWIISMLVQNVTYHPVWEQTDAWGTELRSFQQVLSDPIYISEIVLIIVFCIQWGCGIGGYCAARFNWMNSRENVVWRGHSCTASSKAFWYVDIFFIQQIHWNISPVLPPTVQPGLVD